MSRSAVRKFQISNLRFQNCGSASVSFAVLSTCHTGDEPALKKFVLGLPANGSPKAHGEWFGQWPHHESYFLPPAAFAAPESFARISSSRRMRYSIWYT